MNVNFITGNPALDAYLKANKATSEQEKTAAEVAYLKQHTQQSEQEQPTRLRKLGAEATTAETEAQTGKATAPYAAPQAQSKTRLNAAEATKAETEAQTGQATAPLAVPTAKARLDQIKAGVAEMDVNTANVRIGIFQKELAQAATGDIEGAKAIATAGGLQPFSDHALQDAQTRSTISNTIATAQELYPNRPKDQLTYIASHLAMLGDQKKQGQAPNPQTSPYEQAPGQPAVPETGGAAQDGTERIMASIKAEHQDWPQEKIVAAAHGLVDQQRIETERLAQHAATSDPAYRRDPAGTIKKWREYYGMQPQGGGQQQYSNGATATNLQTGQKIVFSNGQWVDASSGKPINAPAAPQPAQAPAGAQASAAPPRPAYQPGQQPAAPAPEIPL